MALSTPTASKTEIGANARILIVIVCVSAFCARARFARATVWRMNVCKLFSGCELSFGIVTRKPAQPSPARSNTTQTQCGLTHTHKRLSAHPVAYHRAYRGVYLRAAPRWRCLITNSSGARLYSLYIHAKYTHRAHAKSIAGFCGMGG